MTSRKAAFVAWCAAVLDTPDLCLKDALVDLGVNSLSVIVFMLSLADTYGIELSIEDLLAAPSFAEVYDLLERLS